MPGYTLEQLKQMHGDDGFEIVSGDVGVPTQTAPQAPAPQTGGMSLQQLQEMYGNDGFEIIGEDNQPMPAQIPLQPTGIKAGFTREARDVTRDRGVLGQIPDTIRSARGEYQQDLGRYRGGQITGGELGLRTVGSAANVIGSTVGNAVERVATNAYQSLPQGVQGRLERGVQNIGQSEVGQRFGRGLSKIVGAGNQVAQQNPRLAANLQAAGRIASIVPIGAASAQVGKQGLRAGKSIVPALKNIERASDAAKAGNRAKKATGLIKATEETLSSRELQRAIDEGRQVISRTGRVDILPSETEKRAGQILAGKVKANPVKNVPIIKKEITVRGKEVEDYLTRSTKKISNKEYDDAFNAALKEDERYMTPAQKKAYREQVSIFQKELHGRGGYDTSNSYKALKDYERNVTENLPKGADALRADHVAGARLQGAQRVRTVVRDILAQKHPDFKDKMFDLASLYDVKDTVIGQASKVSRTAIGRLVKKYPNASKVVGGTVGLGVLGTGAKKVLGLGNN